MASPCLAYVAPPKPTPPPRLEVPGWREQYGIVAGVTCRGPAGEWDFGLGGRGPVGTVLDRWRALLASEPDFGGVVVSRQAHGTRIGVHRSAEGITILDGRDGHVTDRPGVLLAVTVADCIPVYLADPGRRVVALLHAGWRGLAAGILPAALEALRNLGCALTNVVMHCGVGICGSCYEVGPEVLAACGRAARGTERGQLDLRQVLVDQGRAAGLRVLSTSQMCSAHDPALFFSHRRSEGCDGRMVAYAGLLDRGSAPS